KHFKEVNDTLGHLTGDRVLTQIAHRLADNVRPTDLAARFGGDELVVLLRDAHRRGRVEARAADLLRRLSEPVVVEGLPIIVEAYAGLALAREAWENPLSTGGGTPLTGGSGAPTAAGGVASGTGTPGTGDAIAAATTVGAPDAAAGAAGVVGAVPPVGDVSAVPPVGDMSAVPPVGDMSAVPPVADGDWVAEVMRRADVAMYQ